MKTEPAAEQLLNKKELASRLNITVRGVEELMRKQKIPVIRLGYRTVRFSWPKVEAVIKKFTTLENI